MQRIQGSVLVVAVKLSVNLMALTIEQVIGKRQKVVRDMCTTLQEQIEQDVRPSGPSKESVGPSVASGDMTWANAELLKAIAKCHGPDEAHKVVGQRVGAILRKYSSRKVRCYPPTQLRPHGARTLCPCRTPLTHAATTRRRWATHSHQTPL